LAPDDAVAEAEAAEPLAPEEVAVAKPLLTPVLEPESVVDADESVAAAAVDEPVAVMVPVLDEELGASLHALLVSIGPFKLLGSL
jgi:hypothetical protein